jgi:hypothetical protein
MDGVNWQHLEKFAPRHKEDHGMTIHAIDSNLAKDSARDRFKRLAAEWKKQAQFLSNTHKMVLLKPYQRIIGMGQAAVPFILEELQREPLQWFWALEAITEQNPVPPEAAGKVDRMAQAWIEWGRQHGVISQ